MAKTVAMSASRALGLLITKCKLNESFIFNTYTTLYDSLVWSIISSNPAGTSGYRNGTESFFGLKGRLSVVRDV
jgi:hypothetical protein